MAAGGERVIINIDVNSDIAKIVATRKALEALTKAQNKHNDAVAKGGGGSSSGKGGGSSGGGGGSSGGGGSRTPRPPSKRPKPSSVTKASKGRYEGMGKEVFAFRKDAAMGIAAYGKILKLVNKLALIELPLMAAALSGISLAFQAGTYFVKMYRAAMSTLASSVGVAFVALTTFMAAQREFISVQSSPAYYKGTATTNDRFVAAGQAMSMFVDNSRLAVIGAKGLNAAFTKLSEVKPITGQTTVAFESLMDVVAGSGGDLEGGSKKLADFLAKMQKTGSVSGASAEGKALGPDFEKILKEASAMGIKTSDEFMKAAASGELGATFAEKYKGTLDALNNTLMGRFKIAVNNIKAQLTDLGGGYLGMASNTVARLEGIVSTTIARLSFVISRWQSQGGFDKIVDFIENGSNKLIELMNKYLGTVPGIFGFFKKTFDSIGNGFDKMQDWLRQFKEAGDVLNDIFFSPVFSQLFENFTGGMNTMSDLIKANADTIRGFADQIVNTLTAIGRYTDTVKTLFVSAMPLLTFFLKIIETFFKGFTAINKTVISLNTLLKKYLGAGGKAVGAVLSVAALYAAFTIATRFFATLSKMFGKDMTIKANNVHVHGGGTKGSGGGTKGSGGTKGKTGGYSGSSRAGKFGYKMGQMGFGGSGYGALAAGAGLSFLGSQAGGYDTAGGSVLKGLGNTAMLAGGAMTMAPDMVSKLKKAKLPKSLGANGKALGGGGLMGGAAIIGGSAAAGSYIGGKFNDDSIKSRGSATAAGAAGGAAIGAAIGSMVPVIGTAAGAALGAVVGGISAWANSGKQRKATQTAAKEMMGAYTENINDAFAGGNIDDLLATQKGLVAEQQKFIQGNADPAYAAQALKQYEEQIKTTNSAIETYVGNVSMSEQLLGVGAEALNELATAAGIDLKTKLLSFRDVIDLVGKTVDDKVRLMNQAWGSLTSGITGGVMTAFDKKAQERTASTALDASQTKILGGGGSDAELENYLKQQVLFNTAKFGEAGGMANAYNNVIEGMKAGGELGAVDQATKDKLTAMLSEFGMDPASVIDNVLKQTFTDSAGNTVSGSDRLKELVGTGKDGKLDMNALTQKLKDDPFLLANLQNAGVQGVGTTQENAKAMTSQVLNNGTIGGAYQNGNYKPQSGSSTNNATVVVNASVIDGNTIRQIERAVAEALRLKSERGSTGGVDPRVR